MSAKMAFLIGLVFICSGLLRSSVGEETEQGMCPNADDGDDAMSNDYEESHFGSDYKSKWQSSDNGHHSTLDPDIEIREEGEFDHPVLGKMKLVTIPVPNAHTGQEFTTGYILVNDSDTSEGRDDFLWPEDESYHQNEGPADKYTASSSGTGGDYRGRASGTGTHTLDSLSKLRKNSTAGIQKSSSTSERKTGTSDDLSPLPEEHCSKDCCTCGDPAVPPPKQKCVRERENCCCGDSAREGKDLKDVSGDADANCSWRCCCC